jgi:hypothetical protein
MRSGTALSRRAVLSATRRRMPRTVLETLGDAAGHGDRHSPAGSRSVAHVGMSRNQESRSNRTDKLP